MRGLPIVVATAFLTSCGGKDDGTRDTSIDPGNETDDVIEADVPDEDATSTPSLTVTVVEATHVAILARVTDSTDPLEGATVTLDDPAGGRTELVTGEDGRVTFEVDFSGGTASVTAHLPGHALRTITGLDGSEEEVVLGLFPLDPYSGWVTVSGTATNMISADDHLYVMGSHAMDFYNGPAPSWSLMVEPGRAFRLIGLEISDWTVHADGWTYSYAGWTVIEHDAVTADTTVSLDFASSVTPVSADATVVKQTFGPSSPLTSDHRMHSWVLMDTSMAGMVNHARPSSDGTQFDLSWEFVDAGGAGRPSTVFRLLPPDPTHGIRSYVIIDGYPGAGTLELGFLDIPDVALELDTYYPLHETEIEWSTVESGVDVSLVLWGGTAGEFAPSWLIHGPMDSTSISVPELPSTADASTVFGSGAIGGRIVTAKPLDSEGTYRFSWSKLLLLDP